MRRSSAMNRSHEFHASQLISSLVLLLFFLVVIPQVSGCHEQEREALLKFKHGGLYDPANRLSSWTEEDCCSWAGVGCNNSTGRVVMLDLRNENLDEFGVMPLWNFSLDGKIDPSLIHLQHLKYLDLSGNVFSTMIQIPEFFGSFKHLEYLNLSYAWFGGKIPHQLGNLSNLHTLDLGHNFLLLVDDLRWLSSLSSLQYLDLSLANLSKAENWVQEINQLSFLTELHLQHCWLAKIHSPYPFPNLTASLNILDLSHNIDLSLTAVAHWLTNFSSLTHLYLRYTGLHGSIPPAVGNLTNLEVLDLMGNSIHGTIPKSFSNLCKLRILNLHGNSISSWERYAGCLAISLEQLDLGSNRLSGSTLLTIGNITSLEVLDLSSNFIHGTISASFSNFCRLRILNLNGNSISGWERYTGCLAISLERLDLGNNTLSSSVLLTIGNITSLEVLDLSYNFINGTVPKSFCNLCHLRILNLASNSFRSMERLPRCLYNSLEKLNLRENQLEENLHIWLGEIVDSKTLKILDLSENSFSGNIPLPSEGVIFPSELEELNLGGNKLRGYILQNIGKLSNLARLNISNNSFPIIITEDVLTNLKRLEYMSLADNQLIWKVNSRWLPPNIRRIDMSSCQVGPKFPIWLQHHKGLSELYMSNAIISDDVPDWFWKISVNMTYLFLSSNQLRGYLPNGMSTFQVEFLDLSNNSFSGSLPTDLCMLEPLQQLDLSSNHFHGNVPDCWGKKGDNLWYINLSNNNLSGEVPRSLANLPLLAFLHMKNNSLSGEISSRIKDMKYLVVLDLSYNRLSGVIPVWDVGETLLNLRILSLRSNMIHGNIPSQISLLSSLQLLDLSHNNLSGAIPASFGNFTAMARIHDSTDEVFYYGESDRFNGSSQDKLWMNLKGIELEISGTLGLMNHIDLSSNNLSGDIPEELMHLLGLVGLNLSSNSLEGHIPNNIGALKQLESLDLSKNKLSGEIPSGISILYSLSKLNLSYNNLSGTIPSGFQLQTLDDSSIYIGNENLCGPPLPKKCPTIETPQNDMAKVGTYERENDDESKILWLFISTTLGFVIGLWGFCGILIFKRSWRNAYYQFSDDIMDKVIEKMVFWFARLKRKIKKSTEI